jgi:hypothetical protein
LINSSFLVKCLIITHKWQNLTEYLCLDFPTFFLFGRKSNQKRLVLHVTAENLSNDVWAWRKYGQKPIKGSPYPRLKLYSNSHFFLLFFKNILILLTKHGWNSIPFLVQELLQMQQLKRVCSKKASGEEQHRSKHVYC